MVRVRESTTAQHVVQLSLIIVAILLVALRKLETCSAEVTSFTCIVQTCDQIQDSDSGDCLGEKPDTRSAAYIFQKFAKRSDCLSFPRKLPQLDRAFTFDGKPLIALDMCIVCSIS